MAEDSSQEKSEAPTAKKREDTRKKGNVAKSTDINSVFVLLAAIFMLRISGPWMLESFEMSLRDCMEMFSITDMSVQRLIKIGQDSIILTIKLMLPILGAVFLAGLIANLIQIGWLITFDPIMPKLSKINPLSGIKRLFSLRSVIETVKNILKIIIIGYIAYITIKSEYEILIALADASVAAIWNFILVSTFDIFIRTALVLIVIAIADYSYQRYDHVKKIKMTHQEIKEEHKQMEGDPKVKGRIRRLQMEMSQRRMMDSVPQASVVVTNPTHLAIALRYDAAKDEAPVVVAKGADAVAQRIKKVALENDIPVREDVALARALYPKVEVGMVLPAEFWNAIISILVEIANMKNRAA
ncbi:MAG: flagellar biosynthesis protein FlhB [Chitinispirillia bacterium]|nr:flagellar biosynthesis protein FlhB [Chitinispirillia bacterium]MCL2268630.1 flagellar biosynthesis protein FlhB [Chitinispirillia bacterium]